jgi:hypothetical protein
VAVRLSHLLTAVAIVAALIAGVAFGQVRGRYEALAAVRAKVAAAKAQSGADESPKPAKSKDPNRPRFQTDVRDGKVIGKRRVEYRDGKPFARFRIDLETGTETAIPLENPPKQEE